MGNKGGGDFEMGSGNGWLVSMIDLTASVFNTLVFILSFLVLPER